MKREKQITLIRSLLSVMLCLMAFLSCGKVEEHSGETAFKVCAPCPETKSYLTGGHHKWVTGDLLRVLSADGFCAKTDACDKAYSSFDFTVAQWEKGKVPAYAVYCGQKNVSFEPHISAGSVTLQGSAIRNQFTSWRLVKIKNKYQVQNQCDVIMFICTSTGRFWSPRNYMN